MTCPLAAVRTRLLDSTPLQIETFETLHKREYESLDDREQRGIDEARKVINRLHRRELYVYVNEAKINPRTDERDVEEIIKVVLMLLAHSCMSYTLNAESSTEFIWPSLSTVSTSRKQHFNANEIIGLASSEIKFTADDIITNVNRIDHTMKNQNPLDKVRGDEVGWTAFFKTCRLTPSASPFPPSTHLVSAPHSQVKFFCDFNSRRALFCTVSQGRGISP